MLVTPPMNMYNDTIWLSVVSLMECRPSPRNEWAQGVEPSDREINETRCLQLGAPLIRSSLSKFKKKKNVELTLMLLTHTQSNKNPLLHNTPLQMKRSTGGLVTTS